MVKTQPPTPSTAPSGEYFVDLLKEEESKFEGPRDGLRWVAQWLQENYVKEGDEEKMTETQLLYLAKWWKG